MNTETERVVAVIAGNTVCKVLEKYLVSDRIETSRNRNIARGVLALGGLGAGLAGASGKVTKVSENVALFATALGSNNALEWAAGKDAVLFKWMYPDESRAYSTMRPGELVNIQDERYTRQMNTLRSQVQKLTSENAILKGQPSAPNAAAIATGLSATQMESELGFI
ncbi:hypothetical protein LCGC14_0926540 [marine sediment metagenome]|uniref:Uncharacterized protein n=1 Tax=marine sediment metagenome TaxID=412755 RepID=A0A0F9PA39_9ZZZZ